MAPAWASGPWSIGAELGVLESRWREVDDRGATLLRERGHLPEAALTLAARGPGSLQALLRLSHAEGRRAYDGQTQAGVPLGTRTDLREQALQLQALWGDEDGWRVGARLTGAITHRGIRSTPLAAGYPERHQRWLSTLVLATGGPLATTGMRWGVEGIAGGGPAGRMDVDLPGYDAVRLQTGRATTAGAAARLSGRWAGAWHWRLELQHQATRSGAGTAAALLRAGQVVGSVSQPASRASTTRLQLSIAFDAGS